MAEKFEPLKGKYGMLIKRIPRKKSIDEIIKIARESVSPEITLYNEGIADGMAIVLNDVKSAVQGLLQEIFIEIKNITQLINDGDTEDRKMGYAYLDGLKFSIEKIKKWLDVVSEDE